MEGEAKCQCQRCGGSIAFPLDYNNTDAACPHCGKETTLRVPAIRAVPAPAAVADAAPASAPAGLENAGTVCALGILLALILPIAGLGVGIYLMAKNEAGRGVAVLVASIFFIILWAAVFLS